MKKMPGQTLAMGGKAPVFGISSTLEKIINDTDPNVNVGIRIAKLSTNEVVFEKNAGRHFMPASTIKLITLAAALHYLGPSYRFKTQLLTDGVAEHTLKNLYLKGSGDPSFTEYDLITLAREIKQMGITTITGSIFVDDKVFDDVLWVKGAMWDDRQNGYSAPISGINFNHNRLLIKSKAGVAGKSAYAIVTPFTNYVDVSTKAVTAPGGRELTLTIDRGEGHDSVWPFVSNDGLRQGDRIVLAGYTSKGAAPYYTKLAINDPPMLAATSLKEELTRLGVNCTSTIVRKAVPGDAMLLAQHDSRSLAEAIIDFTKVSNNIANDSLVKAMAAESGEKPATFATGLKEINNFLVNQVGIAGNNIITADGGGTSRYSLVTPEQMVQLLTYAANHFHMGPEFMAAMPIGGEDGTLGSRLAGTRGQIRAKTGFMTGISSLAGYLTANDGERYAFAIMVNGFVGSAAKYLKMQDEILMATIESDQTAVAKAP